MDLKQQFGMKIDSIRLEKKHTTEALAGLLGISAQHLRMIVNGERSPGLSLFYKICNVLETPPTFFMADGLEIEEPEEIKKMITLYRTCSPKQLKILSEMMDVFIRNS